MPEGERKIAQSYLHAAIGSEFRLQGGAHFQDVPGALYPDGKRMAVAGLVVLDRVFYQHLYRHGGQSAREGEIVPIKIRVHRLKMI